MASFRKNKPAGTHKKLIKPPSPSLKEKLDQWCHRQRVFIIAGILIVSIGFRLVYFLELNNTHLVYQHKWEESDMFVFDDWAKSITGGDFSSKSYTQPEHNWMKEIAQRFFKEHPDKKKEYISKAGSDTSDASLSKLLWVHWNGGKAFPYEPLYPYFIAMTYKISHNDVRWVFIWQLVLGVITNILIYLVTRRYFGDFAAVIAGFLSLFCGPLLFYEIVLLRSSLACFFSILIVYLTSLAADKNTRLWWLIAGIACGIAMAVHTFFILFFMGTIIAELFLNRRSFSKLWLNPLAYILGFFLALSPVMIRNASLGVGWMTMSNKSVISFITMNDNTFPGCYIGWSTDDATVTEIMAKTDGSFLRSVFLTLKTHPSLSSYLRVIWGKLQASFSWFEIPNNANFYFYREVAPVLSVTFITFLFLTPLALTGIILAILKKINSWPLYLMFFVLMFPLLVFMVLSRYRIPLAVVLIPFAGYLVSALFDRGKIWQKIALACGILIFSIFSLSTGSAEIVKIPKLDYAVIYNNHYLPPLQKEFDHKNWKKVTVMIQDFFDRYEPKLVRSMLPFYHARDKNESDIFDFFAKVHTVRSNMCFLAGDSAASQTEKEIAAKLKSAVME